MVETLRQRLLDRLGEPWPLVVLEGIPGAGKRTLLRQWANAPAGDALRGLATLDRRQPTMPAVIVQLLRALEKRGAEVPRAAYQRLVAATDREESIDIFGSVLAGLGPVEVGIVGYERLPPDAFGGFAALHRRLPLLRVLMETTDAGGAVERAAADGLPLATIGDEELAFDPDEVAHLLSAVGPKPAPGAAEALWEATRGHVGTTVAAIRSDPRACLAGEVTRAHVLHTWWEWRDQPLPFEEYLLKTALVPRFTPGEAERFTGQSRGREHAERMAVLGFGRIGRHPRLAQPAFVWDEDARRALLASAARLDAPLVGPDDYRALADAARHVGDLDLAVVALLQARDFREAEETVRVGLALVPAVGDLVLWEPLLRLAADSLEPYPALQFLRTAVPHGSPARSERLVARLQGYAERLATDAVDSPRERLWRLALATRAALHAGLPARATELARAWLALAGDVEEVLRAAPAQAASMAVWMIRVLAQLDHPLQAWRVSELVLDAVRPADVDPNSLDEALLGAALRTRASVATVLGHARPGDGIGLLPPPRPGSSELDEVLAGVTRAWALLDAGDVSGADRASGRAMAECADPTQWPILVLTRVVCLIVTRSTTGLQRLHGRHLDTPQWRRWTEEGTSEVVALVNLLVPIGLGRRPADEPDPHTLPVAAMLARHFAGDPHQLAPAELDGLPPRLRLFALGLSSLQALRAENTDLAAESLTLLCAELPACPVAPLAFGLASAEEVEQLRQLHDHPGGHCGEFWALAPAFAAALATTIRAVELSERECELLVHLRRGASNQEVAREWFVSINTVKFHRANLYRKLGAGTREEALAAALRWGY